jgi:hypothetical protein
MARIMTVSHHTHGDFSSARAILHTPIAPEMEQEGEASSSRIRLPYRDVRKFQRDESNAGAIPGFLCQNQILIVCMTQDQLFHTYGQKCSQITKCHE